MRSELSLKFNRFSGFNSQHNLTIEYLYMTTISRWDELYPADLSPILYHFAQVVLCLCMGYSLIQEKYDLLLPHPQPPLPVFQRKVRRGPEGEVIWARQGVHCAERTIADSFNLHFIWT